jgi:hypothetical protein
MTPARAQHLDRIVVGILGPVLADDRRGLLDRDEVAGRAARAANAIRAALRHSHAPMILHCTDCRALTPEDECAMIAGDPFCRACAPAHRLAPPPRYGA